MSFAQTVNGRLRRVPSWPVYLLALLPALWIVWLIFAGGLGVDPVKELEHRVGLWALRLIILGLCVTPLRRWTGISLIRYRRAIGLMAFFYVVLHLLVWILLDLQLRWTEIGAHIVKQPFITIGMAAFVLLIPLAATSNDLSLRRLGAAGWRKLHRLVYPAAVLGALHFLLIGKVILSEAVIYLAIVAGLLALRLMWSGRRLLARAA